MKKTIKFSMFILFLISVFALTACADETIEETSESPYKGKSLNVSGQQVWTRNSFATKISQAYLNYKNEGGYDVDVYLQTESPQYVGSGNIKNGVFNFSTSAVNEETQLLDWTYFRELFSLWDNPSHNSSGLKGNILILYAYDEETPVGPLDRQRITGTKNTITQETLIYVYINKNCNITGTKNTGYIQGQYYYYTEGNLYLPLRKGWNIISRTETYSVNFSGSAHIGMKIKIPIENSEDYKWVIEPGFGL